MLYPPTEENTPYWQHDLLISRKSYLLEACYTHHQQINFHSHWQQGVHQLFVGWASGRLQLVALCMHMQLQEWRIISRLSEM